MNFKQKISLFLRSRGWLETADYFRFLQKTYKNAGKNTRFIKKNPMLKPPPDRLMYEIFGDVDYFHYFRSGEKAANSIIELSSKFIDLKSAAILEWGCGTGRITHNLRSLLSRDVKIYASDINQEMLDWCSVFIDDVNFSANKIEPPFEYSDNSFDLVYSTSVFTHLSEIYQKQWLEEALRVLKPNGIFIFTVHGDYYANRKLAEDELRKYNVGLIVERMNANEGSRSATIFQSPKYMKEVLLKDCDIIEHLSEHNYELAGSQDIWIIRK